MELLTSKIKCGDTWFAHFYLCPYLPLAAGTDALSLSLIKFKQRIQPDLNAWIDCSARLLGQLYFSPDTIIIRPLRHDETTARPDFPSALDLLGQSLATHFRCRYLPTLLTKSRPTLPNKYLTRRERRSQLQDVYQLTTTPPSAGAPNPTPLNPYTPFLLIDDILTTGTTMRALISTIRRDYPDCPINAFTLTRADYTQRGTARTYGSQINPLEFLKSGPCANTV
jgi:predicted amidophosphoribosyltransferase